MTIYIELQAYYFSSGLGYPTKDDLGMSFTLTKNNLTNMDFRILEKRQPTLSPIVLLVFFSTSFLSTYSFSHGGGLDNNGGHNQSGVYHCHRSPCQSGNTIPAVKEELVNADYDRNDWKHWSDFDGNCLDSRQETLKKDSLEPVKLAAKGCLVVSGLWIDPFRGKRVTSPTVLDVDHIIPLKFVHLHGGRNWTPELKEQFANDPRNLLAVDAGENRQKGGKGPSEWLPTDNPEFICSYLILWEEILEIYPIVLTSTEESDFIVLKMTHCG